MRKCIKRPVQAKPSILHPSPSNSLRNTSLPNRYFLRTLSPIVLITMSVRGISGAALSVADLETQVTLMMAVYEASARTPGGLRNGTRW